ncbi:MAG TPA: DUF3343 domain-containing protein [Candidatus Blautia faecavium]|uniref:DUF3343 domain-containing protein n=1 Tax=Candidatus Blautia faecavium TaxID=2838487 RepID=A0A9D2LQF8_9FIRM|nr:DUF3343 domain-containing protein [Candidatus Blautia faecavium]
MKEFIATFYSHFGAIQFKKACDRKGLKAVIMPVPRSLSSSCGTCVRFFAQNQEEFPAKPEELEQIVETDGTNYIPVYHVQE